MSEKALEGRSDLVDAADFPDLGCGGGDGGAPRSVAVGLRQAGLVEGKEVGRLRSLGTSLCGGGGGGGGGEDRDILTFYYTPFSFFRMDTYVC